MAARSNIQSTKKMNSGYEIPVVGFGVSGQLPSRTVWLLTTLNRCTKPKAYHNEAECGEAIRKSGLKRSEVFFTTKVPWRSLGYEPTREAIESSLKEAKVDYFDLALLHAPYGGKEKREGSWKALVEAQKEGKVRSIGVSNYGVHHLDELEEYNKAIGGKIDVGQYELHPWLTRSDIVEWLQKRNIVIEAYSPLVQAKKMDDPKLQEIAKKHNKSPAQVLVRWSLQKGFVPLPKSATEKRILENSDIFDFELSQDDMRALHTDEYHHVCWDPTTHKDGDNIP
ncbi:aldehyde reductase, putative [Trichophyton verrucosum HKI 0517]|uniref:D-xylose reductase [NAD(P)H] n=1 Tax=Trichophyton verrucosum (strain HKI 0517) TaxID=663202 RepID=D4DDA8_TRIVH|nr:aldehyde reductase, putative [Trichophyton verrucosum HKI 0517]EFE40164.1 aldehyde reductase, putative [Trichophyton verrucosum HKI 0517]